ncbi:MAG: threonylcarbamoyl-AMP synthase [Dethiobacter sp.]|jgi:L-threonylcarbamoyladenylate synthase|nr:threonylcarbamoyl-AMP synthase [Dethiobacter sp.]
MESSDDLNWPTQKGTLVINARNDGSVSTGILHAARILKEGGLVAFPTETVYGLGADALNGEAVARIFAVKGRPTDNPLIVHIDAVSHLKSLAVNIPSEAYALARRFWPGPLTLVLESARVVPPETTGGLDTVALRIPQHPVALELIRAAAVPVAGPSANLSGRPSPTTAQHVLDDLSGSIDAVLDGGPCEVGVESTVLDIRGGEPLLLRPGGVTREEISALLGRECRLPSWQDDSAAPPPSPGLKYTHYSPRAPLYLVNGHPAAVLARLQVLAQHYSERGKKVGLLISSENVGAVACEHMEVLGSRHDPAAQAVVLFAALRRFDEQGVDVILAEGYPEDGVGLAVMNRLRKAAGHRIIDVK